MTAAPAPQDVPGAAPQIAGLWRRLFALSIDSLILALVGGCLGLVLSDYLSRVGGWGWTIGFAVVVTYFGVLNSGTGGGQTIGKRLARIRVVGSDGNELSLDKSLARAGVLWIPYFLSGAPLELVLPVWFAGILTYLMFGVGLSIVYLFIFNRKTRQSLHDQLVGSYVVMADSVMVPAAGTLWRGHYAVILAIMILAVAVPVAVRQLGQSELYSSLLASQQVITKEPGVEYARINVQTDINIEDGTRRSRRLVLVRVVLSSKATDVEALANKVARLVLNTSPEAANMEEIAVLVSYGYDIGIAYGMQTRTFSHSPAKWRERVGP
jgi:uncharacterized RDD family membrane protein YckC